MDKDPQILKLPISPPHIQAEAGLKIIGVTLLLSGFIFFLGFFYVAILSKLLPSSENHILSAIQNDSLEENGTCSGVFPIGAINMHVSGKKILIFSRIKCGYVVFLVSGTANANSYNIHQLFIGDHLKNQLHDNEEENILSEAKHFDGLGNMKP